MPRMPADQRRAQARIAARDLLRSGVTIDRLTLRLVAEEAGVPLPTLTYAYGAVGELIGDLRVEFEHLVAVKQRTMGPGGLTVELTRMNDEYLDILVNDPSNIEVLRWQMLLIMRGEIVSPGGLSMRSCLRRIQETSGEQWALPIEELSMLAQGMISGAHVQFFVRGADEVALAAWRREAHEWVAALGRLALPDGAAPRGD